MISILQGKLFEVNEESCTILAGGVGYELHCALSTLADLQSQVQQNVFVYVHTHVREDVLQLFGFSTLADKNVFLSLLKVNGIGPKSAINILSGATAVQLADMISREDVKALSKLPKVGKKTAEQMILSLKGKLVLSNSAVPSTAATSLAPIGMKIRSALVNLGFRPVEVEKVVSSMHEVSFEEGVRQGLAALTNL